VYQLADPDGLRPLNQFHDQDAELKGWMSAMLCFIRAGVRVCFFVCVRACLCAHIIVCPGEMGNTKTPDIYLQEIAQKDLNLTSPGPLRKVYAMLSDFSHASIHTMLKTGMRNTTSMPLSAHEKEILSIIVQIEERNRQHIFTATGTLDYQCIHNLQKI